jgi:hypothetical protein
MAGPITNLQPIGSGQITNLVPIGGDTSPQQASPKTFDPSQQTPGTATMRPLKSEDFSFWDRMKAGVPGLERIQSAVQSTMPGLTGGASSLEATAKPSPGSQDPRLLAPELTRTPEERRQEPIKTGIAEFAGGMTSPENLLLAGATLNAPYGLARALGATFAVQNLRGAYQQLPDLQEATKRRDWSEVERIGTHVVLGATMGAIGARQAATGTNAYEQFRQDGKTFSRIKNLSDTRQAIETNGVGLYNRVRDAVTTHQEALKQQGSQAIQQAIDADNASQTIKGRGNISTTSAVNAASDVLAKGSYNMKPAERTAFNALAGKSELTLQEAKLLRTQFGRMAFERSGSPEFKSAATAAYNELGEAMRGRIDELYGTDKPYHFYNNRFKMAFELNEGAAGHMLDSLQGQDAQASVDPLKRFSKANLKEITQQMRDTGNDQLASQLDKSQKDAKALTAAHDTVSGKFFSGAYRMLMQHPQQSWPGLVAMAAAHGIAPFPIPQVVGMGVGAANMLRVAVGESGRIGDRLQGELPPEKFQTRTQAMPQETFTPKNPDEGWTPPKGSGGGDLPPYAGPSFPKEYGKAPQTTSAQGGAGANYSAEEAAKIREKYGAKDFVSNPVGERAISGYSSNKVISNGVTYEHRGGQFYRNGKILDSGADIADAVDALESQPHQKVIEGEDTNITRERKGEVDDTKKAKIDQLQFLRARADQGDAQAKRRIRDIEKPVSVKEVSPQDRAEKRARLAKAKGVK